MIERHTDAKRINEILNDPSVRPWVADEEGVLDISEQVADRRNVLLVGEYGGVFFRQLMPGLYEAHTQVLPRGRGRWARWLVTACAEWMFTKTDAMEIMTRVPEGHVAAKILTAFSGMRYEFTRHNECRFQGNDVPVEIYSGRLQDWMGTAVAMIERGKAFHERLHAEAERLGISEPAHDDDENHNQYVGACIAMVQGGQLMKAVTFYNRWALACRHPTVEIVSQEPPVIKFDIGLLKITGPEISDVEVVQC